MYTIILFAVIGFIIGIFTVLKDEYHRGLSIVDRSTLVPSIFVSFIYAFAWAWFGVFIAACLSVIPIAELQVKADLAPLYEENNQVVWYSATKDSLLIKYEGDALAMYNAVLPRSDTEIATTRGKPLFIIEYLKYMDNNWCFHFLHNRYQYKLCLPDNTQSP